MYRTSTIMLRATSRWISRFQFCVYGDTRLYVPMESDRSVVEITNGTVVGVPAGKGIGNVIFESDVYVEGVYSKPAAATEDPTRLIPGTVPMVLSTSMKSRAAPP